MALRVAVRPPPFRIILFFALMPSIMPRVRPAVSAFRVPRTAWPTTIPVGHLAVLALDAAFLARLRRGGSYEQREETHMAMGQPSLWVFLPGLPLRGG